MSGPAPPAVPEIAAGIGMRLESLDKVDVDGEKDANDEKGDDARNDAVRKERERCDDA